eukprot:scaffold1750_cov281-Prasinococcus_capsulatus_cf.AAC.1
MLRWEGARRPIAERRRWYLRRSAARVARDKAGRPASGVSAREQLQSWSRFAVWPGLSAR